jgi:hypothetical protein
MLASVAAHLALPFLAPAVVRGGRGDDDDDGDDGAVFSLFLFGDGGSVLFSLSLSLSLSLFDLLVIIHDEQR